MRKIRCAFLLLTATFLLTGCQPQDKDSAAVQPTLHDTRTHCIGRFLVELPSSFRRAYLPAGGIGDATFYFGRNTDFQTVNVSVIAEAVTAERFAAAVVKRAEDIASAINYQTNTSMLVGRDDWSPSQVQLRHYASADIADAKTFELHVLVDDVHAVLTTTAYEEQQIAQAEGRLRSVLSGLHKVLDTERTEDGFCLGPLLVGVKSDFEESAVSYSDSGRTYGNTRFRFSINTFRQGDDEPSLVARGEANLEGLGVRPDVLRKGGRRLAGMEAEQWLGRFEENGVRQHGFYAETTIREPSPQDPKLLIEMFTGGEEADGTPLSSRLDDEQALLLWDGVTASLRRR